MKDTLTIKGSIILKQFRNGKLIKTIEKQNIITNAGKAQIALLAGASGTPFTYLALGTSNTAAAASQTALVAEIVTNSLTRSAATVSRVTTTVTNDTLQLLFTWTASGSSTVEEIGMFNASSAGTMLNRALTGSMALVSGDQLQATYKVAFV